jgi:hypothetical protein
MIAHAFTSSCFPQPLSAAWHPCCMLVAACGGRACHHRQSPGAFWVATEAAHRCRSKSIALRRHDWSTTVAADPDAPGVAIAAKIEIIFRKNPSRNASVVTLGQGSKRRRWTTTKAGMRKVQDPADAYALAADLVDGSDQIKRLRANTWENLGFFRGIGVAMAERLRTSAKWSRSTAWPASKLAFVMIIAHIIFYRYFDLGDRPAGPTPKRIRGSTDSRRRAKSSPVAFEVSAKTLADHPVQAARWQTQTGHDHALRRSP